MKVKYVTRLLIFFSIIVISISTLGEETSNRERIELNDDWQFKFLNDEQWKTIDIPHDFSIIQQFSDRCEGESGFLPGGSALYKKTFTIKRDNPSTAILYFYGVYLSSYVTVNEHKVGENHYGYNSFAFDVTKYLHFDDQENTIEVKVDNLPYSSRWYSGSGMIRGVFLMVTDLIHVGLDGIIITTPKIEDKTATAHIETKIVNNKDKATLQLVYNILDKDQEIVANLTTDLKEFDKGETLDKQDITVDNANLWSDKTPYLYTLEVTILLDEEIVDKHSIRFGFRTFTFNKDKGFTINGVPTKLHGVCLHHDYGALGSIDNYDAAYKRFIQLKEFGINALRTTHNPSYRTWIDICDELGIYVIEEFYDTWNFHKNGNEHDFAEYFNEIIKDDNEILGKKPGMTWAEFVIKSTIYRDRNSPSLIMWSIGNEVQAADGSNSIAKNLVIWGKEADDTRPFTRADTTFKWNDGAQKAVNAQIRDLGGIIGYNYPDPVNLEEGRNSWGAVYQSETASAQNSRGVYSNLENGGATGKHDGNFHLTSYDVSYHGWVTPAYYSLRLALSVDYCSGQFVWTGYDYIGEPSPFDRGSGKGPYPNTAYYGILDTCGFPKDTYYLYRAQLDRKSVTVHLVTAWDKNNIYIDNSRKSPVHIYSNAAKIELFRSDKNDKICTSTRTNVKTDAGFEYYTYKAESNDGSCDALNPSNDWPNLGTDLFSRYNIEFVEGTKLYTKAYDENGELIDTKNIIGNHFMRAPDLSKMKMVVNVDKKKIKADGRSLSYISVSLEDEEGIVNTKGANLIIFQIEGPGKILGVDNGDQATIDKFQQEQVKKSDDFASIKAYAGKALAIISSTRKEGTIKLTVSSEGFDDFEESIVTEA